MGGVRAGVAAVALVVAQVVVIAAVVISPWLFGSVELRAQSWLLAAWLATAGCLGLGIVLGDDRRTTIQPEWEQRTELQPGLFFLILIVITAVGLGFLQLFPLNRATAAAVSPAALALRDDLASEANASDEALVARLRLPAAAESHPISLCPHSTRLELAWLALGGASFLFGAWLFASPTAQVALWAAVAANGAALAFFGLVQKLSYNGMIYWTVPLSQGGSPFGPFVNRNNAAGYLNLCLACALGLVIWAFQRSGFLGIRTAPLRTSTASIAASRWHGAGRFSLGLRDFLARLNGRTAVALVFATFILSGVVVSLSRGGILALACAIVATAAIVVASRQFSGRVVWAAIVVLAGLGVVGWVNAGESVRARLATLLERAAFEEGRMGHWRDAVRAVPDFWRTGSGLGTYRYVYGLYETKPASAWFYHAENQYLETLIEGGVVGLSLFVAFLGLVGAASWRLLRGGADELAPVVGWVGLFALATQVVHAFFDFGLRIPANSVLFALICGSVSGRASRGAFRPGVVQSRGTVGRKLVVRNWRAARLVPVGLVAAVAALVAWGASQTAAAAKMEITLKHVPVVQAWTDAADGHLCQTIGEVSEALSAVPDDAAGHATLAKLWIALYRSREFRVLERLATPNARRDVLWMETSPQFLHGRAQRLARVKMDDALERLRGRFVVQETLAVGLRHLLLARRFNPMLPDVHLLTAELSVLFADPGADQIHVERARRLAPANPELLYRCGLLDYQARRWDSALSSWQRSLALSENRLADVLCWLGPELESAETVRRVLPPKPELLIRLAANHFHSASFSRQRANVLDYAAESLPSAAIPDAQRHYLSGAVLALQGRAAEAIAEYSQALECHPRETAWRFELASILESLGQWEEARRQARLCLVVDPDRTEYRELLHRISMAEAGRGPDKREPLR